ncbi:MAG: ABC transporter permease [Lachnospiraceae bacterium]|jgi:NitT/TauT family transport system permease protein|nr:ABC transporter permease [Lachnospiraceae bacterium]
MDKLSEAQLNYLRKRSFHRRKVIWGRLALLVILLAAWETAARTGLINSFIFSCPSRVALTAWEMASDGSLWLHLGVTLGETLVSFLAVTFFGLLAAVLLWLFPAASEILEPYLVMLNSLPKSALAPLLIVWLGNRISTVIVAAVSVAVFGSIITLHTGFQEIDNDKVKLIYSLGGTKKDVMFKVIIPGSIPMLISNMKVNVGLCLVGVIIGEFLSAKAGLGYLIIYASQTFKMDWMLMSIVILCLISTLLYQGIHMLEKKW